jgi:hypothetical protein
MNEAIYDIHCPHTNASEDLDGSPIYWELTGKISSGFKALNAKLSAEHLVNRHIRQQEMMVEACRHQSLKHKKLIEKQAIVFNLENLSYAVDLTAMEVFKKTLQIDQNYYPERLKYFFMINTPWFFGAIWSVIRPFLDPVTAEKFQIVGADYLPHLRKYISNDNIPSIYGGNLKAFKWGHPYPEDDGCSERGIRRYNDRKYFIWSSDRKEVDKAVFNGEIVEKRVELRYQTLTLTSCGSNNCESSGHNPQIKTSPSILLVRYNMNVLDSNHALFLGSGLLTCNINNSSRVADQASDQLTYHLIAVHIDSSQHNQRAVYYKTKTNWTAEVRGRAAENIGVSDTDAILTHLASIKGSEPPEVLLVFEKGV